MRSRSTPTLPVAIAAAALVALACSDRAPMWTPTGPEASVTVAYPTVTILPTGDSTLAPGQSIQFSTRLYSLVRGTWTGQYITWRTSDPKVATVSKTGRVTGVSAGTTTITATTLSNTVGTRTLRVGSVAYPTVTILPTGDATLAAGRSLQLSTRLYSLVRGTWTGQYIAWKSSNSSVLSVTSRGLVTAHGSGTATITATTLSHTTGTRTFTVSGSAPANPGNTASRAVVDECNDPKPGWLWCDDFQQNRLSRYFEYSNGNGSFTRVAGVGVDGSEGMRVHFNRGQVSAGWLHVALGRTPSSYFRPVDGGTSNYRELYWRVYVRYQNGWVGGGGDKLSRAISFASPNWSEAMVAPVWSGSNKKDNLVIDPHSGTNLSGALATTHYNDFGHFRWLGAVASQTPIFDAQHVGKWYCVEAHARMNDPDQSNGLFQLWIDGRLEAEHAGMNWVGNYTRYGMNAIFLENYWNAGSPQAQNRYLDNFVVSTRPIGC